MKLTVFSVLFAFTFLLDGDVVSAALPLNSIDDFDLNPDITSKGLAENSLGSGPGVSNIILVADADLLRLLRTLGRNVPERNRSPDGSDGSLDLGSSISIIKRDTKRCMVGRVYRPCWEV